MATKGSRGDDDVTVLSAEEACEAPASVGSVKRRKLASSSDVSNAGGLAAEEGSHKVALCPQPGKGPCSRCGLGGHRAGDCDARLEEEVGGGSAPVITEDGNVPDLACPCGSGKCLVLTSNTAKNPGRKFYSCPLAPNNGGCYFFKWCDQPNPGLAPCQKVSNKYSTPVFKGKSCDLFKWLCDRAAQHSLTVIDQETSKELSKNMSTRQSNERDNSRCYRCGEEGHWHRDCPNRLPSSSDSSENTTGKPPASTSSNSCFRCGEDGHWARDCPKKLSSSSTDASVGTGKKSSGSNKCFKCCKLGHWARECPNLQKG
ncbi:DNA-binding protein HEXBP-like [Zingiber officinale]|uniref:Uncharacterized protein n=1 Tax=Zingiber officinale TaxID=94328 RepID=A0A8J5LNH8_ZINOF|nr:DNA-binding protein HEXBP-like [Zingiber officinale]KAG6526802.1 hypothetical protein ZIOFF_016803 [Zingiber officinale]